jgi:anti-sigma factor RsiW
MSDHNHVASLLEKYVDGELQSDERTSVEKHLQGCSHCQRVLDELLALRHHLRAAVETGVANAPVARVWAGIWESVTEKLGPPTVMERLWWAGKALVFPFRLLKALAWGAALAIITLFILPLVTTPPPPQVVVESVESEHPVMIFQREAAVTVIWLFEQKEE